MKEQPMSKGEPMANIIYSLLEGGKRLNEKRWHFFYL